MGDTTAGICLVSDTWQNPAVADPSRNGPNCMCELRNKGEINTSLRWMLHKSCQALTVVVYLSLT